MEQMNSTIVYQKNGNPIKEEDMEKSNWEEDCKKEKEIGLFLDENYYPSQFKSFERISERELQLKGIDVIVCKDKKIKLDEKAQTDYVNEDLPTAAFEVSFLDRKGNEGIGWFKDPSKETELYLIVGIHVKPDKVTNFTKEDINYLDFILIDRQRLSQFINQYYTDEEIKRIFQELKQNKLIKKNCSNECPWVTFSYSIHKAEKPCNIVIKKDKLKQLSLQCGDIYPN